VSGLHVGGYRRRPRATDDELILERLDVDAIGLHSGQVGADQECVGSLVDIDAGLPDIVGGKADVGPANHLVHQRSNGVGEVRETTASGEFMQHETASRGMLMEASRLG